MTGGDPVDTARAIVAVLRENFATFIAGSLAYSAFMSIVPLLTLVLVASTLLGDQRLATRALQISELYLTPTVTELFGDALQSPKGRVGASLISVLLLLWSGLRVFRGLNASFAMFYGTAETTTVVESLRDGLLVLGALGVALLASVVVGAASATLPVTLTGSRLAPLVLVVPLVVAFLPVYYVFPDVDVTVRESLPGVLVAAVGWTVLQVVFQAYAAEVGQFDVYGTIGGVLLVLTWLYVASLLLLVGAAVNVVLAGRTPDALEETPRPGGATLSD